MSENPTRLNDESSAVPPARRPRPGPVDAEVFGELARWFQTQSGAGELLDEITLAAVALIPGVQQASISRVVKRRQITCEHPRGDLPPKVDALQVELGEGPCLSAIYSDRVVRVPDMRAEERWPGFSRRAAELGVGSMLAFRLYVDGDNLGALNLYSREIGAFGAESEDVGELFASHAAVAFADSRKIEQLHESVASRDQIGQAKGILMERYKVDADTAFRILTRVSQDTNRKLRDVAEELTTTGALATRDPGR